MLFDTHAHYDDRQFDEDREILLSSMQENGVGYIVNAGCSVNSSRVGTELSEKYDFVYATAGIHPNSEDNLREESFEEIRKLAIHPKVVAIGEIGLDYYWKRIEKEVQKAAFARQIAIADELSLPFVIHSRDACKDTIDILKSEYKGGGALMHCFSESKETAKILLDMGLMFAIGGTVTFKNNVRTVEAVKYIPLESLVLETDSPYLAPTPNRGKRNSSLYIHYVAEKIAEIKGISAEEVEAVTTQNAKDFFSIK